MNLEGTLVVGAGEGARTLRIATRDLGSGGASVESSEPLSVGSAVTLRLMLPAAKDGSARPIELPARVTRTEGDNPCTLGLDFTPAPRAVLETLKRFIFRARDGSHR
jgi:c-di-GMP-binding flagellar brake protein YcgR